MTIAPVSSTLASVMGTAATPVQPASASNTESAPASTSPTRKTEQLKLPPAPLERASYPKSVIPQPFPPAFPKVNLPPPDPAGLQDTVSISDAGRVAASAGAGTAEATLSMMA